VVIHLYGQGKNLGDGFGNRLEILGFEKILTSVNFHGVLVNTHLAVVKHLVIVVTETGDAVDGFTDALEGVL
jgi:hypothetical protein